LFFAVAFLIPALLIGTGIFGALSAIGYGGLGEFTPIGEGDFYDKVPYENYISAAEIPEGYDVRDYGAGTDKSAKENSKAINKAVSKASSEGGGTVVIQGGSYTSGTVYLKDNVTLFIAYGSEIKASHKFGDFKTAFVFADKVKNVRVTGGGKISGEGEYFVKPPDYPHNSEISAVSDIRALNDGYFSRIRYEKPGRPLYMVFFNRCEKISVDNIILYNSMHWTLCAESSKDFKVEDVVIDNNRHVANTDGIDIVGTSDAVVRRVFISTADDGIVIKNPKRTGTNMSNVSISDCEIMSVTNAFKIGTETYYDISGVRLTNNKAFVEGIYPAGVSGISIESVDGSRVTDVQINGFEMENITCPLFIRLGNRNRYKSKNYGGILSGISVWNVTATNAELPSIISGVAVNRNVALRVRNVSIYNFNVTYRECAENVILPEKVPEFKNDYPENWRFGDVPAYGLYIRHAEKVELYNFNVASRTVDTRDEIFKEDYIN